MSCHTRFKRPMTTRGNICATPSDVNMIALLGGKRQNGVSFTRDQLRSLERLYGFNLTGAGNHAVKYAEERHAEAVEAYQAYMDDPDISDWKKQGRRSPEPPKTDQISRFIVAGSERNLFRVVQEDGLRVMAFLSKFLEQGQDPVKLLVQIMDGAGFDVEDHVEWACGEHDDELGRPTGT